MPSPKNVSIKAPYQGTLYDRSAVMTGASQQVIGENVNRTYLAVWNSSNDPIGVNPTGGVAAIGGVGTITILPGESEKFVDWVPTNAIQMIGTNGDTICILEG
jgi:hypothetical protein